MNRFVPGELGLGLVEGYDNMGYEMSKPHLRAALEEDLKASVYYSFFNDFLDFLNLKYFRICDGTKTKEG